MAPKGKGKAGSAKGDALAGEEGKKKKTTADYAAQELERLRHFSESEKQREQFYDMSNYENDKSSWVETLAVHLAAEPDFAQWMKNPQALESITLTKDWLGAVYLSGRSHKFGDIPKWHKNWFSTGDHKMRILKAAKAIYEELVPTSQSTIENTIVAKPDNSARTQDYREHLFKLQSTRQKLVHLIKSCTDTEYALTAFNKAFGVRAMSTQVNQEVLEAASELEELEEAKAEARSMLGRSKLNQAGLQMLDDLLKDMEPDGAHGLLYKMPQSSQFGIHDPTESQTDKSQPQQPDIQDDDESLITLTPDSAGQVKGVTIDFNGHRQLGDQSPRAFTLRTPQDKDWKALQVSHAITDDAVLSGAQLEESDQESTEWLSEVKSQVDAAQFKLTFREFEKVVQRPEKCEGAKASSTIWINPRYWLDVLKDNIVHVRRIVNAMVDNNMIKVNSLDKLQSCLRRMWALMALAFGCWPEPALLCTIMDALLEDLAGVVIGHLDPKFETVRMNLMAEALATRTTDSDGPRQPTAPDLARLENEHKAREMFAELARFFRGSILMAVAGCSPKIGDKNKAEQETWFVELVKLNSRCGHRACKEQLEVKVKKEAKTQRYNLSVAVEDARIGFPDERSFISSNRSFAYSCFYHFLMAVRYHAGLGPFFHYYAHLWHPACRPFRGKQSLIEDIRLAESQLKESQSSAQGSELSMEE